MGAMSYLLDTHTFLWAAVDEEKLSNNALKIIENVDSMLFVSAVSAYEIMYKHKLGKLPDYTYVAESYFEILDKLGVNELQLSTRHAHFAGKTEWEHRDPFDRLLAAQAALDNLTLITNDIAFHDLSWINVLW
jgi:PIN domain nuclease of toxin-antitoxin system